MRREIAAYERGTHPPQRLYEIHQNWRRIEFRVLRRLVAAVDTGSHSWHILQNRLSRTSSVGVDLEMRSWFYSRTLQGCGELLCVFPDVTMHYPLNIRIGTEVFINRGVNITAPAPVTLGDHSLIGPYTVINSGNHRFSDAQRRIRDQGHDIAPITIGSDAWLGAHVTVLAGVRIGEGAVVGAGAVVTRDVPAHAVAVGVPARVVAHRS
ncbi:acyltransferase [Streptomyces sp. NPDC001165]|uniref:acyltransferase n=1 Tax=Streptomyces sp. NPDC001165 TaxID=3364546 RepID=UPI0036849DC3